MTVVNTVSLGTPVNSLENRTASICIRNGVPYLVIAAKGLLLSVNLKTYEVCQLDYPVETNGEYPYDSCSDMSGLFYTSAKKLILVYDPEKNSWYDVQKHAIQSEEIAGICMTASNRDNKVYFSSYPGTYLSEYDSATKKLSLLEQLDENEMYTGTMAVCNKGWIYAGIGTHRKDIIAFHPEKSEKVSFLKDEERTSGYGYVCQTVTGEVFGKKDRDEEENWYSLIDGRWQSIDQPVELIQSVQGAGFHRINHSHRFQGEVTYSLPDQTCTINGSDIPLNYQSKGADLSPIAQWNDSIIGTSNHPLRLYTYQTDYRVYPKEIVQYGGGGNICAYTQWEDSLYGAAYAGGHIHRISQHEEGLKVDYLSSVPGIYRPRAAMTMNDNSKLIFGGFGAYGALGGGLVVLDPRTEEMDVWNNEELVVGESVVSLVSYTGDLVVAGTSIETPGGAKPISQNAHLLVLDIKKKKKMEVHSFERVREIKQLAIDQKEMLHLVTGCSLYIVWDLKKKEEISRTDLKSYGVIVREGMVQQGDVLYFIFSKALLKVKNEQIGVLQHLQLEATMGGAILGNQLYYTSRAELHALLLEEEVPCID